MLALITGGAGFIGYHLAKELLEHGYEVTIVDNFERGVMDVSLQQLKKEKNIKIISLDLMEQKNYELLNESYHYIFHLAAIIGVQNVLNHPDAVLRNNVELLFHMIDFAKKQKELKRFVFASTSEVYAGTLQYFDMEIPTPESTPLALTALDHKRTSYMLSKLYGEAVLHQSGLPFTIVRPHNFYGPRMGMQHVVPELLRKVWFDEGNGTLQVFSPDHKRTFCYISDAVSIIRQLAESGQSIGKEYNVGNESPEISIMEVAKLIIKILNKPCAVVEGETTPGSPKRRCPNMKKTQECIGKSETVSLEEGIKKTFLWYQEHIFSGMEEGAK